MEKKIDNITEGVTEIKEELKELKKSNQSLSDQIKLLENCLNVPEYHIMVSIS